MRVLRSNSCQDQHWKCIVETCLRCLTYIQVQLRFECTDIQQGNKRVIYMRMQLSKYQRMTQIQLNNQ
jgi:hypothetical protein